MHLWYHIRGPEWHSVDEQSHHQLTHRCYHFSWQFVGQRSEDLKIPEIPWMLGWTWVKWFVSPICTCHPISTCWQMGYPWVDCHLSPSIPVDHGKWSNCWPSLETLRGSQTGIAVQREQRGAYNLYRNMGFEGLRWFKTAGAESVRQI